MSFDYAASAATAQRLIARFGQDATLNRMVNSGTEWAPTQTPDDKTIKVVDLNQVIGSEEEGSGTLTKRTLLVSTSAGVEPKKEDKVTIGGKKHEIEDVRPLRPGGVAVLYEVDLER